MKPGGHNFPAGAVMSELAAHAEQVPHAGTLCMRGADVVW